MQEDSYTEPVSVSGFDQSKSAFDDNIPPSQSAIDDPSELDNTVTVADPAKEGEKDKEEASKTDGPGSEGKTDLSANPEGQQEAEKPKEEKKKSGGFCACLSKKKKEEPEE